MCAKTYGTGDQTYIYILRRFVPIAYPALSLGMAYAIASLGQQRRLFQRGSQIAAGALALLLMGFFVFTGLPIFRTRRIGGRRRANRAACTSVQQERYRTDARRRFRL